MLITISRQYGAGGSHVAQRVADLLGWRVVDNELVERVAAEAGLAPEDVARREERVPGFVQRLAQALVAGTPEAGPGPAIVVPLSSLAEPDLVRVTERVVAQIAAEGRVVLVGRAAAAVLASERQAIHVRVVASREYRIRVAADRLALSPEEAARITDDTDKSRARYHRDYYKREWADPVSYDMTLNTETLGLDGAARVIADEARARGWGSGERGKGKGEGGAP
jgi:cytidylate kinase